MPAIFKPRTGEVVSNELDEIACWFIETDCNKEGFFVRYAYFFGANDPYSALKTTLKAEIDPDAWARLQSVALKHLHHLILAVERPTKFELIINLNAPKQTGLRIPSNVLARMKTKGSTAFSY